jgi:hypothetical protein
MKRFLAIIAVSFVMFVAIFCLYIWTGGTESAQGDLPYRETALTLAGVMITHQPVVVHCVHPPNVPWVDGYVGYASWPPPEIWLRNCYDTIRLVFGFLSTFSHELLHIEHPNWSEKRVYATEASRVSVVKLAIIRAKLIIKLRDHPVFDGGKIRIVP